MRLPEAVARPPQPSAPTWLRRRSPTVAASSSFPLASRGQSVLAPMAPNPTRAPMRAPPGPATRSAGPCTDQPRRTQGRHRGRWLGTGPSLLLPSRLPASHCSSSSSPSPSSRVWWAPYLAPLLLLACLSHQVSAQISQGSREYCQLETFEASCDSDEVIAMEQAKYGRMRMGRCVKGDLGYMGCSADVLDITDRRCSGRHRCEIGIPNEEFERTKPCYMELKSYFEAQYHCVKVATVDHSICRSCDSVKVTAQSGYIASVVTDESGCGSAFCPWILEGKPGQRINLTMLDFTAPATPELSSGGVDDCAQLNDYVFLKEDREGQSVGVCGGNRRRKHVYMTLKHRVSVTIGTAVQRQNNGHFLIYYEIVGCPDVTPAEDAWFRREADGLTAVVGCISTDQVWTLTCMGDNWLGKVGNCTKGEPKAEISETAHIMVGGISIAYSTAVVIIVIVALIVGVSVLGLGMLIWKWPRRSPRNRRNGCPTNATSKPSSDVYDSVKQTVYEVEPVENLDTYLQHHRNLKIERYACSHMWDVPPAHQGCDLVCDYAMRRNQMLATYNGGTSETGDNRGSEVVVTTVDSYPRTLPRCQTPEGVLDPPRYFELEAQAL